MFSLPDLLVDAKVVPGGQLNTGRFVGGASERFYHLIQLRVGPRGVDYLAVLAGFFEVREYCTEEREGFPCACGTL